MDNHYPTIDFEFIDSQIRASQSFLTAIEVGSTVTYFQKDKVNVFKNNSIIHKGRDNQISFLQSMGLAYKFKFIAELISWLSEFRNFQDGGFKC